MKDDNISQLHHVNDIQTNVQVRDSGNYLLHVPLGVSIVPSATRSALIRAAFTNYIYIYIYSPHTHTHTSYEHG